MGLNGLFMSANHLAAGGTEGRFEPQRQNNGVLYISGLESFGEGVKDSEDVIALSLQSFPIPKQRNEPVLLPYMNQVRKVAGRAEVDEIEVVVRDFVDTKTALILLNWRASVYDPQTGRVGFARNYKREAEVHLFGPGINTGAGTGQSAAGKVPVRKFRLEGVWPSMLDPGDIDHEGTEKLTMNMTLQVDKLYPIASDWGGTLIRPQSGGLGSGGGITPGPIPLPI